MGLAELRRYSRETYDYETGKSDYVVEAEIEISEEGVEYLTTPNDLDDDDIFYYEWVYLGNRFERLL